jgi:hypothetical protein
MNLAAALTAKDLGGLFELDADGTVVYSRLRRNKVLFDPEPGAVGCNFFDEVAAFENVEDFRRRFRYFVKSTHSIENFNFDFRFEENAVPMRVMLVRISETDHNENARRVIVDIRKI